MGYILPERSRLFLLLAYVGVGVEVVPGMALLSLPPQVLRLCLPYSEEGCSEKKKKKN
jgi:hypothetical protein